MTNTRFALNALLAGSLAVLPALAAPATDAQPQADDTTKTGKGASGAGASQEVAIQAVTDAMLRTESHLGDILTNAPDSAKAGLQKAIDASRAGREKALAALSGTKGETSTGASTQTADVHVSAEAKAQAKLAIVQGRKNAGSALDLEMEKADASSRSALHSALDAVNGGSHDALLALDRIRPDRPERMTAAAGVRAGADVKVTRPNR